MLAVMAGISVLTAPATAIASGDQTPDLFAQRQALQVQAASIISDRGTSVAQLLAAQDHLADLRRQLDRNAALLAELESHQAALTTDIAVAGERLGVKRAALASLTRQQYKTRDDATVPEIVFGSSSLGQVVDRLIATEAVGNRAHATILDLKDAQRALADESAALRASQVQATATQAQLTAQKSEVLAEAADYQARVSALDNTATDLLARIDVLNAAIVAANRPPGGGATPSQQAVIQIIRVAAARYGANADQMIRVARCESGLNPRAYSASSGASGLFQFMPGTFYGHGGHDIWDATDQSNVAAKMFSQGQASAWACR